jgi:hypothetical protein
MQSIVFSFNTEDKKIIIFEIKFPEFTELYKRFKWYVIIDNVLEHLEFDKIENNVRYFKNGSYMDIINKVFVYDNNSYQCEKSDENLENSLKYIYLNNKHI